MSGEPEGRPGSRRLQHRRGRGERSRELRGRRDHERRSARPSVLPGTDGADRQEETRSGEKAEETGSVVRVCRVAWYAAYATMRARPAVRVPKACSCVSTSASAEKIGERDCGFAPSPRASSHLEPRRPVESCADVGFGQACHVKRGRGKGWDAQLPGRVNWRHCDLDQTGRGPAGHAGRRR